jgi:hypothetical protein
VLYFAGLAGGTALASHHVATMAEISVFWRVVCKGGVNALLAWVVYTALEPWVRRRWPQVLISWTRYTVKGIRDPLVGRGLLFGAAFACVGAALRLLRMALHGYGGEPWMGWLDPLASLRMTAAAGLLQVAGSLFGPLLVLFLLFVLRVVLRKEWAAAVVCVVLVAAINDPSADYSKVDWAIILVDTALGVFVLLRYGLLVLIAAVGLGGFLMGIPRTLDFSLWYAPMGMLPLAAVALIAVYGFRVSLAGRRLFKDELE